MSTHIGIKRVYDPQTSQDGFRVLIDRLWPRGVSRQALHYDLWCKELAPSPDLRKWFGHKEANWVRFKHDYEQELRAPQAQQRMRELLEQADKADITLLYAAKDADHNHALILADELKRVRCGRHS